MNLPGPLIHNQVRLDEAGVREKKRLRGGSRTAVFYKSNAKNTDGDP